MTAQLRDDIIRKRFDQKVAQPYSLPTSYPNAPFSEPTDSTWARLTIRPGDSAQITMGATKNYRTPGILYIQIMNLAGKGDLEARQLAEIIVPFFRSQTTDGIKWRTPSIIPVGRDRTWWVTNVTCPFYSDEVAA